jgi:hypothetical protein
MLLRTPPASSARSWWPLDRHGDRAVAGAHDPDDNEDFDAGIIALPSANTGSAPSGPRPAFASSASRTSHDLAAGHALRLRRRPTGCPPAPAGLVDMALMILQRRPVIPSARAYVIIMMKPARRR